MQPAALDTWDRKYRLRARDGTPIDPDLAGTQVRVARALAATEATAELRETWTERFLWALRHGAIPAGRIIANAGAGEHKPATSTINCTVSGTVRDSMDDILGKLHEAGMTLKAGAGIGYEFSTLRPKGDYVSGAGAYTSGPLSFMDIFDRMCFTIASAGGRRGAQMATFDVSHPDVLDVIAAKREAGRLRQFNISLLVTRDFMEAVKADAPWQLVFPLSRHEIAAGDVDLEDPAQVVWRPWPVADDYATNARGEVACRIHRTLPARELWDTIMRSTYVFAEPGFILIDRYNEMNNNWFCESIRATNPCGEQGLPPYGACLLGSLNLTAFVRDPFTAQAGFDWTLFREVTAVFTRMLDNVVEIHGLPLAPQREELRRKRRHGMGFLGLGSALAMLRIPYGSPPAVEFSREVSRELALTGWRVGLALAREKGPAPIMEECFTLTALHFAARPELAADGYKVGDAVPGRILHARYSRYMRQIAAIDPALVDALADTGARFTHHSSIAPTGTIALSLGNNVSNGIEPSFAHHYVRNVIRPGRKTKEKVDVDSYEALAYREFLRRKGLSDDDARNAALPEYFRTSDDVPPRAHVDMQAAAQAWVDSSISKTINVPADFPFDAFKDIYLYAYEQGLKGCTTFRFNPGMFQGVLVKPRDLAETRYRFTLADGSTMEVRGDEEIEYEGARHTAANLFDALKEGYYGAL
ncbi:MAG: adenosylcobalamin-dependent ribonucleoside-diphosphate reductase [Gammaproteobacteria bacterium]